MCTTVVIVLYNTFHLDIWSVCSTYCVHSCRRMPNTVSFFPFFLASLLSSTHCIIHYAAYNWWSTKSFELMVQERLARAYDSSFMYHSSFGWNILELPFLAYWYVENVIRGSNVTTWDCQIYFSPLLLSIWSQAVRCWDLCLVICQQTCWYQVNQILFLPFCCFTLVMISSKVKVKKKQSRDMGEIEKVKQQLRLGNVKEPRNSSSSIWLSYFLSKYNWDAWNDIRIKRNQRLDLRRYCMRSSTHPCPSIFLNFISVSISLYSCIIKSITVVETIKMPNSSFYVKTKKKHRQRSSHRFWY